MTYVECSSFPTNHSLHLQVTHERAPDDDKGFASTFQYKVVEGSIQRRHYGLELASLASLPRDVLTTARSVATRLNDLEQRGMLFHFVLANIRPQLNPGGSPSDPPQGHCRGKLPSSWADS